MCRCVGIISLPAVLPEQPPHDVELLLVLESVRAVGEQAHVHVAVLAAEPIEGRPEDEDPAVELLRKQSCIQIHQD